MPLCRERDVSTRDRFGACVACQNGGEPLSTGFVGEPHRGPATEHPAIAPGQYCQWHRIEVQTFRGESIGVARGPMLVGGSGEDAKVGKAAEALGEDIRGDTQTLLKLIESP